MLRITECLQSNIIVLLLEKSIAPLNTRKSTCMSTWLWILRGKQFDNNQEFYAAKNRDYQARLREI